MFIYAEVLGMLGVFYSSHRTPITIPLFIAMTALSRLIILQGKEGDPSILIYESGAILLIALACWIVHGMRSKAAPQKTTPRNDFTRHVVRNLPLLSRKTGVPHDANRFGCSLIFVIFRCASVLKAFGAHECSYFPPKIKHPTDRFRRAYEQRVAIIHVYLVERQNLRSFLFFLLCATFITAHAQVFDRLHESSPQPLLAKPVVWVAVPRGSVSSPDELADVYNFQPYRVNTILPTSDNEEVWVKFALSATDVPQVWFMRIPRHTIIKATLFSRDASGNWQGKSAGEAIAPAQWALRTRVPSFELQTRTDGERSYYLRFEHRIAITERPMLLSPMEYVDGSSRVGTIIGLMWGMFGLLAILSVAAFAITANWVFVWFGVSVVTLLFSQLVLIGYPAWRIWPQSLYLNQVMPWVSGLLALAAATWLCAQASYSRHSHPWIYRMLAFIAATCIVIACFVALNEDRLPRSLLNLWAGFAIMALMGSLVWMSIRGQLWNALLLAGTLPMAMAALARLSYNVGWTMHIEMAQTISVLAAVSGLLWVFLALAWRSRDSLLSRERAAALAAYDPATGLMLPHIIDIRLPQMLLRAGRLKPGCGVMMLRWIKRGEAQNSQGSDRSHAALTQIGAILRGASRDIDTVVRYSDETFMMLIEGPVSRGALSEVATQILAACIRFSQRSDNTMPLSLHIAIWHGGPGIHITQAIVDSLKQRLRHMAKGTRRPVQFVDTAITSPDFEVSDDQRKKDLIAKIDAIETAHAASGAGRSPAGPAAIPELADSAKAAQ
jgi:GGDEF domain-containing protein